MEFYFRILNAMLKAPSAAAIDAPKKSKSDATAVILISLIDPDTTIIPQSNPVLFLALFNLSLYDFESFQFKGSSFGIEF